MMTQNTHYTAVIQVHKVTRPQADPTARPPRDGGPLRGPAEKVEVANVVIRATSLDGLKAKVSAHIELVDES